MLVIQFETVTKVPVTTQLCCESFHSLQSQPHPHLGTKNDVTQSR